MSTYLKQTVKWHRLKLFKETLEKSPTDDAWTTAKVTEGCLWFHVLVAAQSLGQPPNLVPIATRPFACQFQQHFRFRSLFSVYFNFKSTFHSLGLPVDRRTQLFLHLDIYLLCKYTNL